MPPHHAFEEKASSESAGTGPNRALGHRTAGVCAAAPLQPTITLGSSRAQLSSSCMAILAWQRGSRTATGGSRGRVGAGVQVGSEGLQHRLTHLTACPTPASADHWAELQGQDDHLCWLNRRVVGQLLSSSNLTAVPAWCLGYWPGIVVYERPDEWYGAMPGLQAGQSWTTEPQPMLWGVMPVYGLA